MTPSRMIGKKPLTLSTLLFAAASFSCNGGPTASPQSGLNLMSSAEAAEGAQAETLTLALKYVEYTDASGKPVLSQEQLTRLTDQMNEIVKTCNIRFVAEEVQNVNPADYGLTFSLDSLNALDKIRAQFDNPKQLLVVNTGEWDHGSVGSANAWTTMPGQTPSGAVIEAPVADFAAIVAHELGHYLNLDHTSDESNLMNPIIYEYSKGLEQGQCDEMRESAKTSRGDTLR